MRCLGRLILLVFLLGAAGVAWLYRDDLRRWTEQQLHPATAAARIGRPSPAGLASALAKLDSLQRTRQDSVRVTPNEMASLLVQGTTFLPGSTFDSISVEFGDRTTRIRTLIESASIPSTWRALIPGRPERFEEVVIRGVLTPVHTGLAELELQHVSVRGIPLPSDVIGRLVANATGRGSDGRLEVVLPQTVGGFRVRRDGVVVYRQGAMR
jgi:hypothetical protein